MYYSDTSSTQRTLALLYPLEFSMISGALYHLVATYSVRKPVWSWFGSATRARPKSHICSGNTHTHTKTIYTTEQTHVHTAISIHSWPCTIQQPQIHRHSLLKRAIGEYTRAIIWFKLNQTSKCHMPLTPFQCFDTVSWTVQNRALAYPKDLIRLWKSLCDTQSNRELSRVHSLVEQKLKVSQPSAKRYMSCKQTGSIRS